MSEVPLDSTVGLGLGPYDSPRGGACSYGRGTPVGHTGWTQGGSYGQGNGLSATRLPPQQTQRSQKNRHDPTQSDQESDQEILSDQGREGGLFHRTSK